jgi:hypothetical protein
LPTASNTLKGDAKKEAFELSTFREFAEAAHLPVDWSENARPPLPDIRSQIDGEEYWFELGRITDTKLAKAISIGWPEDPRPFSVAQKEPLLRILEKKAVAQYQTNGRPVDLVLHYDQQPPDGIALARHIDEHAIALGAMLQRGPFTRIWIYDKWSRSVRWRNGSQ